jgi:hypothetical protein
MQDSLQPEHVELLVKYLRFVRFKRAQNLRDVKSAFEEVIESRLAALALNLFSFVRYIRLPG